MTSSTSIMRPFKGLKMLRDCIYKIQSLVIKAPAFSSLTFLPSQLTSPKVLQTK